MSEPGNEAGGVADKPVVDPELEEGEIIHMKEEEAHSLNRGRESGDVDFKCNACLNIGLSQRVGQRGTICDKYCNFFWFSGQFNDH